MPSPKVGFCCGAFDLLHPGHVLMLADAAGQCDRLVVGLHVDPSVERPHKNTPIQTLPERIITLSAIRHVTEIRTYNTEQDLVELLMYIKPDIRILGSDWKGREYTGADLDIPIHWHKRDHGWSTSELRERICRASVR